MNAPPPAVRNVSTVSATPSQYAVELKEQEQPLAPNAVAKMPFRTRRAGRVVDIVGLPPNVIIVRAALGRERFSREEMRCSLAEHLALDPYEAKAGSYMIFEVMNLGSAPAVVKGIVLVENEHGPEADMSGTKMGVSALTESHVRTAAPSADPDADGPLIRRRKRPEDDAKVEAIIETATPGAGARSGRRPTRSTSRQSARDAMRAKMRQERLQQTAPATAGAARAGAGAGAVAGAAAVAGAGAGASSVVDPRPLPKAIRAQLVMTRKRRREKLGPAVVVEPSVVTAPAGALVAIIHRADAEMLDLLVTSGVPLSPDARVGIACAIRDAGPDGTVDATFLALVLPAEDLETLADALDARADYAVDVDVVAPAVRHALDGTAGQTTDASAMVVASAPSAQAAPPPAAVAPPPAPSTLDALEEGDAAGEETANDAALKPMTRQDVDALYDREIDELRRQLDEKKQRRQLEPRAIEDREDEKVPPPPTSSSARAAASILANEGNEPPRDARSAAEQGARDERGSTHNNVVPLERGHANANEVGRVR